MNKTSCGDEFVYYINETGRLLLLCLRINNEFLFRRLLIFTNDNWWPICYLFFFSFSDGKNKILFICFVVIFHFARFFFAFRMWINNVSQSKLRRHQIFHALTLSILQFYFSFIFYEIWYCLSLFATFSVLMSHEHYDKTCRNSFYLLLSFKMGLSEKQTEIAMETFKNNWMHQPNICTQFTI